MKSSLLLVFLFVVALVGGAGLFWYKSEIPDVSSLNNKVQFQLNKIRSLDTSINELALRNRTNIETNYDAITESTSQLKNAVKAFSSNYSGFHNTQNTLLNKRYDALLQETEIKAELVERFKTRFAVLRNSERYVPIVGNRLVKKAQESSLADIATLYRDTIIAVFSFSNQYESNEDSSLTELIAQLQASEQSMPEDALADIIEFNRHATTLLNEKTYVDQYLKNLLQTNTEKNITELNLAWADWIKQFDKPKQLFEYAILGYVVYILLLLSITLFLLHSLYKALANKVEEKTAELQSTFDQLQKSESQLMQAEKMSSLGQLVAGIAHEVNTPLGYISSNITTVKRNLQELNGVWQAIQELNRAVSKGVVDRKNISKLLRGIILSYRTSKARKTIIEVEELLNDSSQGLAEISQLVLSLIDFSRVNKSDDASAQVLESLKSTIKICSSIIGDRKVIREYEDSLPEVSFTPVQLNQVFLNILTNAAHATPENTGEIHIKTALRNKRVIVAFIDNGCGMDEPTQKRIFDPFFTTKGVNEGSGLGMSIVYKIIKSNGGEIEIDSRVGEGTTVRVFLPLK